MTDNRQATTPSGMPLPETGGNRNEELRRMAQAAADARRRAAEGYTAQDYRAELARSRRARRGKIALGVIVGLIALVAIALVLAFTVFLRLVPVSDNAMSPTVVSGQTVAAQPSATISSEDVVACDINGTPQVKRVKAVGGDWATILSDGSMLVSPDMLTSEEVRELAGTGVSVSASRQVPSGSYYVLGDNQQPSTAGLANGDDFVTSDQVIGKVVLKAWPPALV